MESGLGGGYGVRVTVWGIRVMELGFCAYGGCSWG